MRNSAVERELITTEVSCELRGVGMGVGPVVMGIAWWKLEVDSEWRDLVRERRVSEGS